MQSWNMASTGQDAANAALTGVIASVGRDGFASAALGHINRALRVGSWSVYQLWRQRPPVMHLSASHDASDRTGRCFATYRDDGLYRQDCSFAAVQAQHRPGSALMLRMNADEAPSAAHRDAIYRRHGMVERLSVARVEADGSVLAVNLYRHDGQGCFDAAELEHFGLMAAAVIAAAARHIEWSAATPADDRRQALKRRCAALTERELDVLERLLRGLTYDGIAADLGLSVGTVKTYRARAFERLGIHFKNELFASFMPPRA